MHQGIPLLVITLFLLLQSVAAGTGKLRPPVITEDPHDVSVRKHEPTTLNCKADGNPAPIVEWYKDGHKVRITGNRMLLPSGALFFLHVIHNKRDADTGTYWCVATNALGTVRSHNVTVSIGSPHKAPRITEHPVDLLVKKNEAATLSCKADGKPVPSLHWYKDGEKLHISDNRVILPSGSLFFLHVRVGRSQDWDGDTGEYFCVARNEAGEAKSRVAVLAIDTPKPLEVKVLNTSLDKEFLGPTTSRETEFKDAIQQPWFIIITALTVMFITSSLVIVFLMRQVSSNKKPVTTHVTYSTHLQTRDYAPHSHSGHSEHVSRDGGVWLDETWEADKSNTASKLLNTRPAHYYANKLSDYSVIDNSNVLYEEVADYQSMSTFGKVLSEPSPYAISELTSVAKQSRQLRTPTHGSDHYRREAT